MKVLLFSTVFPKGHFREREATAFESKVLGGEKIHTLRKNANGHYKDGEEVSFRVWRGQAYRSKQREFFQGRIALQEVELFSTKSGLSAYVDGKLVNEEQLAENDGLRLEAFRTWFFPEYEGHWRGVVIHWTDFRYAAAPVVPELQVCGGEVSL